jgi:hypothetical protein
MSLLTKLWARALGEERVGTGSASGMDALEARTLLDALNFAIYSPEGFASDQINEFVPIVNPNNQAAEYELWARYETGERDQLIASGTIAALSRGGVTISDSQNPGATVVRKNTPYALELLSSLPLTATLSHYDFDSAIGESFTSTTSLEWSFGDVQKNTAEIRDFILVYNPSDIDSTITLTIYGQNGIAHTESRLVESRRRGGWSVQDIAALAQGEFGVRITSEQFVVAFQSRYQLETGRGWGAIGTPNGSAADGVVTSGSFADNFYNINGDQGGPRFDADATLGILNTNSSPLLGVVTLTFQFDDGNQATTTRTVVVRANGHELVSFREFGLPQGVNFSVVYRANVPVTVTVGRYQGMDGTGHNGSNIAATEWTLGEGYMSRDRGGSAVRESLHIYNPTGIESLRATIEFLGVDGSVLSIERFLHLGTIRVVDLHEVTELRQRAADQWYGIRVTAVQPIVVSFEHWDSGNGGGFGTMLLAGGFILPFRDALAIQTGDPG